MHLITSVLDYLKQQYPKPIDKVSRELQYNYIIQSQQRFTRKKKYIYKKIEESNVERMKKEERKRKREFCGLPNLDPSFYKSGLKTATNVTLT